MWVVWPPGVSWGQTKHVNYLSFLATGPPGSVFPLWVHIIALLLQILPENEKMDTSEKRKQWKNEILEK